MSNIKSHNIGRILSLVEPQELPRLNDEMSVEIKHIDIDDEPTVDILEHLQDACDWIQEGLSLYSAEDKQAGVLVHCRQGISRSESFVVAYPMRFLSIHNADGLPLAREPRTLIYPNEGFHRQLQVWERCKHRLYMASAADETTKEKPAYKAWKDERNNLAKQGEEDVTKARASGIASMAARFGKMRQDALNHSS